MPEQDRKYAGPKFSGRKGQYVGHHWFDDLPLLPDDQRKNFPETRADDEALTHVIGCRCVVCRRPEAWRFVKRRARMTSQ